MDILFLQDEMFYKNVLQIHLVHNLMWFRHIHSLTVSLFCFCFYDLSIAESAVLKSPTIIVWGVMCALSFSKVSFMKLGTLAFGAQVFRIESSTYQIFFDNYEISFLIFFDNTWWKRDCILINCFLQRYEKKLYSCIQNYILE